MERGLPRPGEERLNPRYNPILLMALGSGLLILTYVTSLIYVDSAAKLALAYTVMAIGILTLASGIVLAFIQTFREAPDTRRRI